MIKKICANLPFLLLMLLITISTAAASIEKVHQNTRNLTARGLSYSFNASEEGTLLAMLNLPDEESKEILRMKIGRGRVEILWDGTLDGQRIPDGEYSISLFFDTGNGFIQAEQAIRFTVEPISPPITAANDGTYWAMTPGELDDQEIWRLLMQPIYVFNNHKTAPSGHAFLMQEPNGTGKRVAQIHALSQGLHVLSEANEFGYVLVETYSNYDPSFQPKSPEEKAHAFDIKQGYLKEEDIQRVYVNQEYGIVVDKLTQRMYLYQNGYKVTEFIISTGLIVYDKYFRETVPGEFTTISFTSGFWNEDIYSSFGIRYNGGSLIHEVPAYVREDGVKDYTIFERDLGKKSSGNCVRVQRLPNTQGFNQQWLFETLKSKEPGAAQERYKVLIWDDVNRIDHPNVWMVAPTT